MRDKIIEAKKKLGRKAAELIVKGLDVKKWDDKKGLCPIHNESTPSFIWCEEDRKGEGNFFKCFGCGAKIDYIDFLMMSENLTFREAAKKLCDMVEIEFNIKEKFNREDWFSNYRYPKEIKKTTYDKAEAYLSKRNISINTIEYVNIKEDENGNIIFEYRDLDNTLLNVKYRPSKPIKKGQKKMWFQQDADNCPALFNMQKIDITKPLVISEGEVDTLSIIEAGIANCVSIPYGASDSKWIDFNYEWLEQFEKIILWFDNDNAGKQAISEVVPRLGRHRTYYVEPSEEVLEMVKSAAADKKISIDKCDANNVLIACGKNHIINLIEGAKDFPSKKLKYLMDAEEIDIQNMTKITTGYKELDKKIFGNIMPCFNIITGYTGAGKSTVSTTMQLIAPVENNYNTFVFSGELHEGQLKNWVLKPFAGRNHMVVWKNPGQPDGYTVTKQAAQAIKDYYHDNIILYSDLDDLETSSKSLIDEMEYAFKRYNTKFFLIDNLMCVDIEAIGKNENTEWDSQKRFIKQLMKFTRKYEVNTVLIIHPKKPGQNKERNAYELHGASEIGNLCHRLFWVLQLKDDPEGYNAAIELIKDRATGKHGSICKFYYDYPTMRLYSNKEELNKKYSWEDENQIVYPPDIIPRLVCNLKDETGEVFGNE